MTERDPFLQFNEPFPAAATHPLRAEGGGSLHADKLLRRQLTGWRQTADLRREDVAASLDWSVSKVLRIENGQTGMSVTDTMAMLRVYGVNDQDACDQAVQTTRAVRQLNRTRPLMNPATRTDMEYYEAEAEASTLNVFAGDVIPDFMQTASYARALDSLIYPNAEPSKATAREDLRRSRAAYLLGNHGPRLDIIIDELALSRPVDQSLPPPERLESLNVALQALKKLNTASLADPAEVHNDGLNPNISIRVRPFETGAYWLMQYDRCTILKFADKPKHPQVFVIGPHVKKMTDDPDAIALFRDSFGKAAADAPDCSQTGSLLDQVVLLNDRRRKELRYV